MGLFEQMTSSCFKQTDQGETIFHFPLLFFVSSRGYIIPDCDQAEILKENVTKFHRIWAWIIVPLAAFITATIYDGENLELFLLMAFGLGVLCRLGYILFFLRRLLHGYRKTIDKITFMEAQRMQANAYSMKTLRNHGLLLILLFGFGGLIVLRYDIILGIVSLTLFLLFGLQIAYYARIKYCSAGAGQ